MYDHLGDPLAIRTDGEGAQHEGDAQLVRVAVGAKEIHPLGDELADIEKPPRQPGTGSLARLRLEQVIDQTPERRISPAMV